MPPTRRRRWSSPARTVLDFGGLSRPPDRQVRTISDRTALAIFYSNRGAEALLDGDASGAVSWLRAAVASDPALVPAWVNLGVAERRSGRRQRAAAAYRRALDLAPEHAAARRNMALIGTVR